LVHGPGIAPGRSSSPARAIDVGPTALGLAGLGAMPGALGVSLISAPPAPDRVRVMETYGGAVLNVPGVKAMMADAGPQRLGVLLEGWKLILTGRDVELFHLPDDPKELSNLALEQPDRVAQLRALIDEWDNANATLTNHAADLTDEDRDALKSLGYIQ
jgi:arylsulfatase A-like enzyme